MSIGFVQSVGIAENANTSSFTVVITGVAAGDALVMSLTFNNAAVIPQSITDTSSNTWHLSTSATQNPPLAVNSSIGQTAMVGWALSVAASASLTVTVSFGSTFDIIGGGSLAEFSGVGSESAGVAVTGAGVNPITFTSVTVPSGGLFVGLVGCQFGQGGVTPDSPLIAMPNDTSLFSAYGFPAAGGYTAQWANTSTRSYAGAGAVFAPPPPPASSGSSPVQASLVPVLTAMGVA